MAIRGVDAIGNEYAEVYSMVHDSKTRGNNGLGNRLGTFKIVQQIIDDYFQDTFIGEDVDTGDVCLVMAHEVCGVGGGVAYEVFRLPSLIVKKEPDESIIEEFNNIGFPNPLSPEQLSAALSRKDNYE